MFPCEKVSNWINSWGSSGTNYVLVNYEPDSLISYINVQGDDAKTEKQSYQLINKIIK